MTLEYKTIFKPNSEVKIHTTSGKKHVAVVFGGMSAEREISKLSGLEAIKALVASNKYKVTSIDMGADIALVLDKVKPDVVLNCLHGTYGEDGCLPGLLNIMKIPYTHSGVTASSLFFNKERSREFFISNNISYAKSLVASKKDNYSSDPMERPYVIKPIAQGSSVGIHVVLKDTPFSFSDYKYEYGDKILVEQYMKGQELQVAVLNGKAMGVLEIKMLKRLFYDYDTKYTDGMAQHIYPANISKELRDELLAVSEKIYHKGECNGIIRAEFIYSKEEDKYIILEINTHPGMTSLSICPEIASYYGIDFNMFLEQLLDTARYE